MDTAIMPAAEWYNGSGQYRLHSKWEQYRVFMKDLYDVKKVNLKVSSYRSCGVILCA